jgi:hypothetical protein
LEDPALELERKTVAAGPAGEKAPKLRRLFDAIHFLLTPSGARPGIPDRRPVQLAAGLRLGVPHGGTLLPPTRSKPTEARRPRTIA